MTARAAYFCSFRWPALVRLGLLLGVLLTANLPLRAQLLPHLPAVPVELDISEAALTWHWDTTAAPDSLAGDTLTLPAQVEELQIGRPAPDANGVALYWSTTAEQDTLSFSIERRYEGENTFRRVARVPGQGSGAINRYAFVDQGNSHPQVSYYRLRQHGSPRKPNAVTPAQAVPGALPAPPDPPDPNDVGVEVAAD